MTLKGVALNLKGLRFVSHKCIPSKTLKGVALNPLRVSGLYDMYSKQTLPSLVILGVHTQSIR